MTFSQFITLGTVSKDTAIAKYCKDIATAKNYWQYTRKNFKRMLK